MFLFVTVLFSLCMDNVAFANGQSSHLWISEHAITGLEDGDLADLLRDPSLDIFWRNGTMFPDGGYAIGDGYGEMAHWEPVQIAYLEWIKAHYAQPWSVEAKQHIAFLLGMASHGMADQSYDAMYFRRAYVYDADGMWTESFDTSTDIALVSQTYAQPVVDAWTPLDALLPIFAEQGHEVSEDTISQGQVRLQIAVRWVGGMAAQPDLVEEYDAQFPWGTSNQLNDTVPGSPPREVPIIQAYWRIIWAKLHNQSFSPLLYVQPENHSYDHPRSTDNIESSISVGVSTGINTSLLQPEHIFVQDAQGNYHPVGVDVFYGNNSHIINISPLEDWGEGTYTATVSKDVPLRDGTLLGEDIVWEFSTLSKPMDDTSTSKGCATTSVTSADVFAWMGLWGMLLGRTMRRKNVHR